jgi:hypothetical protein
MLEVRQDECGVNCAVGSGRPMCIAREPPVSVLGSLSLQGVGIWDYPKAQAYHSDTVEHRHGVLKRKVLRREKSLGLS